ncbi:PAS domain S-box-containing protein [Gelidibacter sediminis]|uniref:histidine kinase n=1 Tax=Gelidibacter sediminis TaxID=1608710 RepID=A0A4R7Q057_9FLAO|nr:PAS domain-containing sensor histidine kinase [Gelidibacter sediminis]TDU39790.1 PAS domain S-box-containing protein [Gelidibacter sediminis]
MKESTFNEALQFLKSEGEMGTLIKSKDWSDTSMGPAQNWSVSLKTCLNIILNSKSPMILTWGEDLICFYNDVFRQSLGTTGKHPSNLGMPAAEFWSEIWDDFGPELLNLKHGGEATWKSNQLMPIERNGTLEDAYWSYGFSPVRDVDNDIAGILIIMNETTTSVLANRALVASEERFRKIAEGNSMMIAMADKTKNAVYFNQAWSNFSGKSTRELQNLGWIELVHPSQKEQALKDYLRHMELNDHWESELKMLDKNGQYRWIATYFMPKLSDDKTFESAVSSSLDIHDKKLFSDELEKKVELRTQELKETNLKLEKSNEELQSFAYISSHDLQEPLRKIRTFTSQIVLEDFDNLSEKSKTRINRLEASAQRMQTLINDLLAYSRTNDSDRTLENFDFKLIFNEINNDLKEELNMVDGQLVLNASTEVSVIPFQFKQVLYNLISNAIKFRDHSRKLIVAFSASKVPGASIENNKIDPNKSYTVIRIKDNGIGFNQSSGEKIFDVFKRLHTRKEFEGTGIGLSIVKKIIENHNGFIEAKSESNEGAEFIIYLPYAS